MARRSRENREKEQRPPAVAPTAPPLFPDWRRHAVPVLVLWALALVGYCNSFRDGLVFDNHFIVAQDQRIRQATLHNVDLIFTTDYWFQNSTSSLYRPLTTLSYLFNYAVLGNEASPAGYHAVNLALHFLNILLVYMLGRLLLEEFWPAFAMAALWAVHPILTESVTNIVGRADLLAGFGVLAGLLCYARSIADQRRALLWRMLLAVSTAIGIFSKESGIVVAAAVFLYDIAWCRNAPVRARVMGYAAMAAPVAVFLAVRQQLLAKLPVAATAFTDNPLVGADFLTARFTAVKVLGKYLWLLVWPLRLSCDYSYNQIPLVSWKFNSAEDWKAILALAVCAGAAAAMAICYRRSKPLFFFTGFFFASLAPTSNLVILVGTVMAERFLYLPSIAFAGCLAWAGWRLYARAGAGTRRGLQAALAFLCLAYCGRTFARNLDWFDEESLWRSAAQSTPESYKAHQHLASVLAAPPTPRLDGARVEIERALAILKPLPDLQNVPAVYATAGFCYRSMGPAWYRKSLDILLEGRRLDAAWYEDLVRRNSAPGRTVAVTGWSPLYLELGRTYRALGDFPNALESFAHGRLIEPQTIFFEEMATTYRAANQPEQAAVSLLEGITMGSADQARLAAEVVDLYRQAAPQSCALAGPSLNFECPLVRGQLCVAARNVAVVYHQMHRDQDAATTQRSAIASLGCPPETFR